MLTLFFLVCFLIGVVTIAGVIMKVVAGFMGFLLLIMIFSMVAALIFEPFLLIVTIVVGLSILKGFEGYKKPAEISD